VGIACFPTVGGSGVVASELALGLAARGHAVHVLSSGTPGRLGRHPDGVVLHQVDPFVLPPLEYGAYPLSLAVAMAAVAERERLDLLHVHYAVPHAASALLALQLLRARGLPAPRLVTTLHGTDAGSIGADKGLQPLTRHAVLQSDRVTVPSAWLAARAREALELPASLQVEVIPNSVDPAAFHPQPSRSGAGDLARLFPALDWSARPRRRLLAHASNFRPLKRVADAVLALAELERGGTPCALLLLGDGPERTAVARLARSLGVEDLVALPGEQLELAGLLGLADLFLLPSETESFGLAALEALACGVPVVASRVGGLPEVVREGETGLLVPPGDPGALAAAARSLLTDEPRRAAFATAARADAEARFQPGPVLDRWERLYRSLL
jgi:N-acetyl-alpha-D-glucosaminyl L-malate synthase BshA